MALSERMSMDFMREITKVTRNCTSILGSTDKLYGENMRLYVGIWPDEQLAPQKDSHSTDEVLRCRELCRGWVRAVTRIFIRGDVLAIHSVGIYSSRLLFAYLCVDVVLVYPSAPTDRAFECVCFVLRSAVACTPRAFAASVRGSNTRSIGAGKRARGRTEGGQEVLLVIVRGADAVDQVVSNVL
jgi:hypothetical protein